MLQVAFLGAVSPGSPAATAGPALEYSSPFAQLALAAESELAGDAAVRRRLRQPERHRRDLHRDHRAHDLRDGAQQTLHAVFGRVHPRFGDSRPAMWFNLVVSFLFLFFFRGWGRLAAVISVATIITYLIVPISVMTLRRTAPDLHRPLRVPGLGAARADRVRAGDLDALLGPLAVHRRDHAAADPADAGLSLLPSQGGLARISAGRCAARGG